MGLLHCIVVQQLNSGPVRVCRCGEGNEGYFGLLGADLYFGLFFMLCLVTALNVCVFYDQMMV